MNISNDINTKNGLKTPEGITNGFTNINSDHAAIHKGWAYLTSDYFTLSNGGVKEYCFTCPLDTFVHFKNINVSSLGGSIKLELIRRSTVTENTGTDLNVSNPNDNFDDASDSTVKESPTYTGGSSWIEFYTLADSTNQFVGTSSLTMNPNEEIVFKDGNEQYIIKATNLTSEDVTVEWKAFWYEEPQGKVE